MAHCPLNCPVDLLTMTTPAATQQAERDNVCCSSSCSGCFLQTDHYHWWILSVISTNISATHVQRERSQRNTKGCSLLGRRGRVECKAVLQNKGSQGLIRHLCHLFSAKKALLRDWELLLFLTPLIFFLHACMYIHDRRQLHSGILPDLNERKI